MRLSLSFMMGGKNYPGMTYSRLITPVAYLIETSSHLIMDPAQRGGD